MNIRPVTEADRAGAVWDYRMEINQRRPELTRARIMLEGRSVGVGIFVKSPHGEEATEALAAQLVAEHNASRAAGLDEAARQAEREGFDRGVAAAARDAIQSGAGLRA